MYFTRTHGDSKPVFAIDTLNGSGSATTGVPVSIQGPKLDFFNIDLGGDIAGELGTGAAVELAIRTIEQLATLHIFQAEASTGQMSVAVYPAGAWTASTLQTALRALGASVGVNGYDASGTNVSSSGFKLA